MTNFPDDEDGAVLAALEEQGVDLSLPLEIEFPVAAPDEAAAAAIAEALAAAGYAAQISFDEGEPDEEGVIDPDDEEFGPAWTVYASVTMVADYDEILRIQEELDRLAEPLGGFSDGWGVMLDAPGDEGGE